MMQHEYSHVMCVRVYSSTAVYTHTLTIPPVHGEVQLDEFSTAVRGHLRAGGDLLNLSA